MPAGGTPPWCRQEVSRRGGGSSCLTPRGRCPAGAVGVTPSVCAALLPSQLPHRGSQGDGGSFCPPCVREGGAAELRRKGCRVIIRCKRRHLLCLLRLNLPLTRLSGRCECGRTIIVSPYGSPAEREVLSGTKCRVSNLLLRSRNTHTAALAKKISQKDFLRRGAASVSGVLFGEAEQSQTVLRRDEPLDEKICEHKSIFIRRERICRNSKPKIWSICSMPM